MTLFSKFRLTFQYLDILSYIKRVLHVNTPINHGCIHKVLVLLPSPIYYCPLCNSGIRESIGTGPVHQSVHLCIFLHDGWMDFLHIWYDRVPWAADAHRIWM